MDYEKELIKLEKDLKSLKRSEKFLIVLIVLVSFLFIASLILFILSKFKISTVLLTATALMQVIGAFYINKSSMEITESSMDTVKSSKTIREQMERVKEKQKEVQELLHLKTGQ